MVLPFYNYVRVWVVLRKLKHVPKFGNALISWFLNSVFLRKTAIFFV